MVPCTLYLLWAMTGLTVLVVLGIRTASSRSSASLMYDSDAAKRGSSKAARHRASLPSITVVDSSSSAGRPAAAEAPAGDDDGVGQRAGSSSGASSPASNGGGGGGGLRLRRQRLPRSGGTSPVALAGRRAAAALGFRPAACATAPNAHPLALAFTAGGDPTDTSPWPPLDDSPLRSHRLHSQRGSRLGFLRRLLFWRHFHSVGNGKQKGDNGNGNGKNGGGGFRPWQHLGFLLFWRKRGEKEKSEEEEKIKRHKWLSKVAQLGSAAAALKKLMPVAAAAAAATETVDNCLALGYAVPRTWRTLSWAAKASYAYKTTLSKLDPADADKYAAALSALHEVWAASLLELCRTNGGIYVKAGQMAGAFGAVPIEFRRKLALLEDRARPRPTHQIERVLFEAFGGFSSAIFAEFEPQATAAASLAQVHRARLHTGEAVAVKIQYPGLQRAAEADLLVFRLLGAAMSAAFPGFTMSWLPAELHRKLTEEMDFTVEVRNAARLVRRLSSERRLTVPAVYTHLCSSKVLTMEWIDGCKVNDIDALSDWRVSPRQVALALDAAFAEMTFCHGWLHADPHCGNVMVRRCGRRGFLSWLFGGSWQPFEIVLLDHGSYLALPGPLRRLYCELWCAMFAGEHDAIAEAAGALGGERAGRILPAVLTMQARTKEQRAEVQRQAGVSSFADISRVLASAPRELVEVLRIGATIRHTTSALGESNAERIANSAAFAAKGLRSHYVDVVYSDEEGEEALGASGGASASGASAGGASGTSGASGGASGASSSGAIAGSGGASGASASGAVVAAGGAASTSSSGGGSGKDTVAPIVIVDAPGRYARSRLFRLRVGAKLTALQAWGAAQTVACRTAGAVWWTLGGSIAA